MTDKADFVACHHSCRVSPVGMGDRVCVDLCSLLRPGEGMLVGSFARALFLVHSEVCSAGAHCSCCCSCLFKEKGVVPTADDVHHKALLVMNAFTSPFSALAKVSHMLI